MSRVNLVELATPATGSAMTRVISPVGTKELSILCVSCTFANTGLPDIQAVLTLSINGIVALRSASSLIGAGKTAQVTWQRGGSTCVTLDKSGNATLETGEQATVGIPDMWVNGDVSISIAANTVAGAAATITAGTLLYEEDR